MIKMPCVRFTRQLAAPARCSAAAREATESHMTYLSTLSQLDRDFEAKAAEAVERFYEENCVEEDAGKFRCPLSGKLFKEVCLDPEIARVSLLLLTLGFLLPKACLRTQAY